MFSQDFKEFIELLNKNQIEYLVVGEYAVGIHGYLRYTGAIFQQILKKHKQIKAYNTFQVDSICALGI